MGHPSTAISFSRTSPEESRIYAGQGGGDYVGDVFAYDDTFRENARVYEIHLIEDSRGPRRVHDRSKVRETAQRMVDTLWWR